MTKFIGIASRLHNDEDGASLVEYAVLLGIVITCGVAVIYGVGTWANGIFAQATTVPTPGT